ncbi:MAG: sulfatase-like hydrolase/transferase [Candidatus Latescibacteria bacterium]|nr:sulfatase-like hydrolase/transferase [Candidatus Latescibacterota bacterium]
MPDQQPNIILIITDQQRYDTIAELGFPFMDTPNLDQLVREGTSFDQCYITAPSCGPARASLFTGYYPHTTGIYKNADRWTKTWVSQLADVGYHCVNVGKMHTFPFETPAGFHERYVVENKDRYLEGRYYFDEWDKALAAQGLVKQQRELYRKRDDYNDVLGAFDWELPEDTHSDFFVGNTAKWWLKTKPKPDGPLFMEIGFPGPHPPYDPIPRYAKPYMEKDLPLDEVTQEDLDGQPLPFKKMRVHNCEVDHDSVVHQLDPTAEQRHRQRAYYLANVTMIDEKIGEILEVLEEQGYLENSVVMFTSDHGDCLTDHGHSQKWTMYDTITRVPTIVWSPGRFEGGRKVDGLCQWMDLGPTILEIAGAEPPSTMEAISLLPTLKGEDQDLREHVFAEHTRDGILQETAFMMMVRSKDWKLVNFIDEPMGQLFDLSADPKEEKNLWDDPNHQEKKRELLEIQRQWLIESNLKTSQWQAGWR